MILLEKSPRTWIHNLTGFVPTERVTKSMFLCHLSYQCLYESPIVYTKKYLLKLINLVKNIILEKNQGPIKTISDAYSICKIPFTSKMYVL